MRRKRWLQSPSSASVPKVAVRTQLPWRVKAVLFLALVSIVSLIVTAALVTYHYSRTPAPDSAGAALASAAEVEQVRADVKQALAERDNKAALAAQFASQLQIDRAAQEQMQVQLKALENENARLKEDLAFFESLLPTPANAKGVVIRSFRLQPLKEPDHDKRPGQESEKQALRYRLLIQQSGRPEKDFVGAVSLTVSLQQGGRPWVLQLPDAALPEAGPTPLSFRHYQRVEGVFELPDDAVVRSVQVKIQSNGEVRAQQTFTM